MLGGKKKAMELITVICSSSVPHSKVLILSFSLPFGVFLYLFYVQIFLSC